MLRTASRLAVLLLVAVAASGCGLLGSVTDYFSPSDGADPSAEPLPPADPAPASPPADPTPAPPPAPPAGAGTGAAYQPSYVTNVTGGGSMPSWTTDVVTASCAGDGVADDTSCLQDAANSARDQGRPLVIPTTSAFYKISSYLSIYTSVGGVGGRPTIKQTKPVGDMGADVFRLMPGMTGWIYNLHLVGTHDGSNATGEWAHNIDVGSVTGVTIRGNVLENAMGDAIGTDWSRWDAGDHLSVSFIVDNNTIRNPRRCGIGLVYDQRNWVITNNVIDKQINYVSGIDFEPEGGGTVENFEVAYNKFVMNNRTPNPERGADGKAVFGWQIPASPDPGGNYYIHHNYGTFGTGFSGFGASSGYNWGYIFQSANVEGDSMFDESPHSAP